MTELRACTRGHHYRPGNGCPECHRLWSKAWRDANPEKVRAYTAARDRTVADARTREYRQSEEWREKHRNYMRAWRAARKAGR